MSYSCPGCGWSGDQPSITDASEEVELEGVVEVDRRHQAVCPVCFELLEVWTAQDEADARGDAEYQFRKENR